MFIFLLRLVPGLRRLTEIMDEFNRKTDELDQNMAHEIADLIQQEYEPVRSVAVHVVDPTVLNQREIGVVFRRFPGTAEIILLLGTSEQQADWIWKACKVSDPILSLVLINDLARALMAGIPLQQIQEIQRAGLSQMIETAIWERPGR